MPTRSQNKTILIPSLLALVLVSSATAIHAKKNPKISVADDPSMKSGSPALVLVEITDFECYYCGVSWSRTMTEVDSTFVQTGKLELIHLDLPLQRHSMKAAVAAACAGEQERYWDMYNHLFTNRDALADEDLEGYAADLELDVPAFRKCTSGHKHDAAIREDVRVANSLGVSGTPAFLLGRRVPDSDKVEVLEVIRGAIPFDELEPKISALLK